MSHASNKGTGQPRSLISTFVVRCLDGVMSLVSVNQISSLLLASVAEQASLSLTWSETPEDTFSHDEAQLHYALLCATESRKSYAVRFFCNQQNLCYMCLMVVYPLKSMTRTPGSVTIKYRSPLPTHRDFGLISVLRPINTL